MILGHAHPAVLEAVQATTQNSFSFGAPNKNEVLLAEEILRRVPSCDRARFVSSGTEAVMTAVRLARAATKRNLIVKFAGCYHGHSDALLVQAGSGVATLGLPNSPGVTVGQTQDTIVLDYNDFQAVEDVFSQRGSEIAALITEATPANMGVVPPSTGFNRFLADTAHKHGSLLILDEVMTGFRVSAGGWWGKYGDDEGWEADLYTFGKVIGGGFPVAALAGKAKVMDLLAPLGPVYQAGTLSGNPVATAAGLATLANCTSSVYGQLDDNAKDIGNGISDALSRAGVGHSHQIGGNLFSFFFRPSWVSNFTEAKEQNAAAFSVFFNSMLDQGVYLPPSAFEAWFVSSAITSEDVRVILSAATVAAEATATSIGT
jgi:glutamate-1-semialdehyde 2,1-aminomutase